MSLASVATLTDYFERYGTMLGEKVTKTLRPLFVPDEDTASPLPPLGRRLLTAQSFIVEGARRAWGLDRSLVLCGETGTGKTTMAAAAVHAHAMRPGRPPGYRCLVMCPDHLIEKWEDEIRDTIPGATVITFEKSRKSGRDDSYVEVLQYFQERRLVPGTWREPDGPEFVILGKNQSKMDPQWRGLGFTDKPTGAVRSLPGKTDYARDENGYVVYEDGKPKLATEVIPAAFCPKCGQAVRNRKGNAIDPGMLNGKTAKKQRCEGRYLQEVDVEGRNPTGLDRICPPPVDLNCSEIGRRFEVHGRQYEVRACHEPLWQYVPQPRKSAPARIIQKKGRPCSTT